MLVTFGVARETYTGSGWEGRRRSSRGMRVPIAEGHEREQDRAWVFGRGGAEGECGLLHARGRA
jgi:hypothetical protein